jgi:hypothetical protein
MQKSKRKRSILRRERIYKKGIKKKKKKKKNAKDICQKVKEIKGNFIIK